MQRRGHRLCRQQIAPTGYVPQYHARTAYTMATLERGRVTTTDSFGIVQIVVDCRSKVGLMMGYDHVARFLDRTVSLNG